MAVSADALQFDDAENADAHREHAVPAVRGVDSKLAHRIAHDIRSPLTAIHMCSEAIAMNGDAGARAKYSRIIVEQANAIAWALENLLILVDERLWDPSSESKTDLGAVLRTSLADLGGPQVRRFVGAAEAMPPGTVFVVGVADILRQALRGCLRAIGAICPRDDGARLVVRHVQDACVPADMVCLQFLACPDQDARRPGMPELQLPWDNAEMLAATRIIGEHGGMLSETRQDTGYGIQVMLPLYSPS